MSPVLRELYQKRILELNARPLNFGPLPGHTHEALLHNPLCGDTVTLRLRVEDSVVREARFEGQGCALSRASASLLSVAVLGATPAQALALAAELSRFLARGHEQAEVDRARLGELVALEGVREVPSRLRCATLPWEALARCLAG